MSDAEEFERICASLARYERMSDEEVEDSEYEAVWRRYEELRRQGHGPQPHHLDG